MPVDVKMPKFDKIMDRGTIVQWLKKDGQTVNEGEPLATVETEKFTVELRSPATGTFARTREQGYIAEVGEVVGQVFAAGEPVQVLSAVNPVREAVPLESRSPEMPASGSMVGTPERPGTRATPSAKKLAREMGVQLESVRGSGPGGLISREDVLAYKPAEKPSAGPEEFIDVLGWRKTMAQRMSESRHAAADVTTVAEVDMTDLARLKDEVAPSLEKLGVSITYTSFIVKAVAMAL